MNTTNLVFNVADVICVTIEIGGRVALSFSSPGFKSLSDVLLVARREIGQFAGIAGVTVRNRTQGWNRRIAIASQRAAAA